MSIAQDKACIFGGQAIDKTLTPNHVHTVTLPVNHSSEDIAYACYPAVPKDEGESVPAARTRHAACVQGHELAVFGGCNKDFSLVDFDTSVRIWDINTLKWHSITASTGYDRNAQRNGILLTCFPKSKTPAQVRSQALCIWRPSPSSWRQIFRRH